MSIDIITAAYNEEEVICSFLKSINELNFSKHEVTLIIVNDGSTDNTEKKIMEFSEESKLVIKYISLSRNFGKEYAITAGIHQSKGDAAIIIDCDMQDPINLIPELVNKWEEGFMNVLAKRKTRKGDSFFKRNTAKIFYKLIKKISEIDIEENVGDFRLIDRKVVDEIKKLNEKSRFMKGLLSWPGFSKAVITYDRQNREAGETKWNPISLLKLALNGIFSFSSVPLKIWSYIGAAISIPAGIYLLYILILKTFGNIAVDGYTSIMVAILFLGSIQLIGIGVLGEYLARVFEETKSRPLYVIDKKLILGGHKNDTTS